MESVDTRGLGTLLAMLEDKRAFECGGQPWLQVTQGRLGFEAADVVALSRREPVSIAALDQMAGWVRPGSDAAFWTHQRTDDEERGDASLLAALHAQKRSVEHEALRRRRVSQEAPTRRAVAFVAARNLADQVSSSATHLWNRVASVRRVH